MTVRHCNDKASAAAVVDVIDHVPAGQWFDGIIHQQVEAGNMSRLIVFLQLIQSQTQTGSASAKPFVNHPEMLAGVFL